LLVRSMWWMGLPTLWLDALCQTQKLGYMATQTYFSLIISCLISNMICFLANAGFDTGRAAKK